VYSGFIPLFVLTALLRPTAIENGDGASRAFGRYLADLQRTQSWTTENIEIDAALPKLHQHGRLRAIRRIGAEGNPDFEVLELSGDRTVRQQVIERYLNAQVTASRIPAASVAITPANYEFRYKGAAQAGDITTYVFQIKPRKKRIGMISGELWLDGETGAAVRQSGKLVKSPSLFVKSIGFTREAVISEGEARMFLTHLSVDTRLVGLADLTVTESPVR
jgi:hypothetical protein